MTTQPLGLSDPKYDELCKVVRASYPTSCILWIESVYNDPLEALFQQRKAELNPNVKVLQLYHGTPGKNVQSIVKEGWRVDKNKRAAYGPGTYFSLSATYSSGFTDVSRRDTDADVSYMLVADVLVGRVGCSSRRLNDEDANIDTFVDNLHQPSMYIARNNTDAIPRYVIAFHKAAELEMKKAVKQKKKQPIVDRDHDDDAF